MTEKFDLFGPEEPLILPGEIEIYSNVLKKLTAFLLTFLFVVYPIVPVLAQVDSGIAGDAPASPEIINPDNAAIDPVPEIQPESINVLLAAVDYFKPIGIVRNICPSHMFKNS